MTLREPLLTMLSTAVLTLALLHLASGVDAQTATALSIDVGNSSGCDEISEGDEIEVALRIENVTELTQWEATIVYDRDVLEIVSRDTRLFIAEEPNSNPIDGSEPLPDYNGRHFLGTTDVSAAAESGDGVLAEIVFKAIADGTTVIGIPQFDINGDGRVDEGVQLVRYPSHPIGDVNGDGFFDGEVGWGAVAVDADCAAVETPAPTDPPTSGGTSGTGGGGGSPTTDPVPPDSGQPTDSEPPDVSEPPLTSGETPTSSDNVTDGDSPSPTRSPGSDETGGGEGSSDGSSFPIWVVAALLVGGLAAGAGVVAFAVRRNGFR